MPNAGHRLGPLTVAILAGGLGCMLQSGGEWTADGDGLDAGTDGGRWDADDASPPRDDARDIAPPLDAAPDDAPPVETSVEDGSIDDGSPDGDVEEEDAGPDDAAGEVPCPPGVPETCNGLDDDCNGSVDDGMECALGTVSLCGPCTLGRRTCSATCTWSECATDPGVCSPSAVEACTPPACAIGHRSCDSGCAWGTCVPDHTDCTAGATRPCSLASCGSGTQTCRADCTWGGCDGTCRSGLSCCPGDGCFDLDWTDGHCGNCGTSCGFLSICWDGHCT